MDTIDFKIDQARRLIRARISELQPVLAKAISDSENTADHARLLIGTLEIGRLRSEICFLLDLEKELVQQ